MKTSLAITIAAVLLAASVVAQSRVTPTFRLILENSGLGHLSADDMAKVENFLDGMNKATTASSREKAEAMDSVVDYLKAQGFEPELVMLGRQNERDILIVGKVLREFTTDIPLNLSLRISQFRSGIHFVQKSPSGVTRIIVDGEAYDLRFATWRPFRP